MQKGKTTMKKMIYYLIAAALCALLLAGCGAEQGMIGKDAAKKIALEDAGFTEDQVKRLKVKIDKETIGVSKYEVSFKVGGTEYEYEINAETGKIRSSDVDD